MRDSLGRNHMTNSNTIRVRVPLVAVFYLGLFLIALVLWPIALAALVAKETSSSSATWLLAAACTTLWVLLLLHVAKRCSGPAISYWRGLLVVAASMTTGWFYLSFIVVFPALFITFLLSVAFALWSDLGAGPEVAAARFHKVVARSHRWRMRR